MSKRAEEAALKVYSDKTVNGVLLNYEEHRRLFQEGYEQAEKDTVDRAAEWWYDHIVGFMKEGLAKNVIEEFREAMAGREKED